jgi:hypothetical protein
LAIRAVASPAFRRPGFGNAIRGTLLGIGQNRFTVYERLPSTIGPEFDLPFNPAVFEKQNRLVVVYVNPSTCV